MRRLTMPEKEFKFVFSTNGQRCTLRAPLTIPLIDQTVEELSARLMAAHHLPCYVHDELLERLRAFVEEEQRKQEDFDAETAVQRVQQADVDVNRLVHDWSTAFSQEVLDYARPESISNEAMFSEVYHSLIHSPALETLLNLEHTYAMTVAGVIAQRDKDLAHLEQRQAQEMEEAVKNLGSSYTDEQINQLAQRHFENTQIIESKWASELSSVRDTQRREYRAWVMKVHEDSQSTDTTPTYVHTVKALAGHGPAAAAHDALGGEILPEPFSVQRREESFTVHLGAQMKTMHNLRLVSSDVLSFCKHKPHKVGGQIVPQPQRLQTAISLYSNSLCGLVMLVDNRLNSYTGIKREFSRVCEQSTDFHFPELERQFQDIEEGVIHAGELRAQQRAHQGTSSISSGEDGDRISLKSSGSASSGSERDDRAVRLHPGDFYTTRHSNLAEVHVVFHLVADDSVRSSVSEISSRHPVIMGYRNILKACFRYDIHTLTLPLLLVHEMSEEMTIPWCMKKAELVLKCVKGFMMELATWSGQESRTIQFLVPRALSDETFASISGMVSSIFRMSNPVIARS